MACKEQMRFLMAPEKDVLIFIRLVHCNNKHSKKKKNSRKLKIIDILSRSGWSDTVASGEARASSKKIKVFLRADNVNFYVQIRKILNMQSRWLSCIWWLRGKKWTFLHFYRLINIKWKSQRAVGKNVNRYDENGTFVLFTEKDNTNPEIKPICETSWWWRPGLAGYAGSWPLLEQWILITADNLEEYLL